MDSSGSTSFKPFAKESNHKDDNDDDMDIPFSAQFIQVSLQQLKDKLANVEHDIKSSLVYAQQVTSFVNDDHLLGFLYAENFDIDLALKRLLRYWTDRHELFGDKYIQPLSLYGAMSDRIEDLRKGYLILLPVLDEQGRAVIYFNPALMEDKVDEVVQVWWYLTNVAMENPSVRKNGFVMLGNDKDMRLRHFYPRRVLGIVKSGNNAFHARLHSIHLCNPIKVFPLIASAVKAMLPMRLRQTLIVHSGTDEEVLKSLASYSIPRNCIPASLGGTLDASFLDASITARLKIEQEDNNRTMSRQISIVST